MLGYSCVLLYSKETFTETNIYVCVSFYVIHLESIVGILFY